MSWVRRTNASGRQKRCDNCSGVIDIQEHYWFTGEELYCQDCPPEDA